MPAREPGQILEGEADVLAEGPGRTPGERSEGGALSRILVFVATDGGRIRRASLEVLSEARRQAQAAGLSVDALLVAADPNEYVEAVAAFGPSRILTISHDVFSEHRAQPLLAALSAAISFASPRLVLLASTESAKDVLGALAVRTSGAAIPDVASFWVDGATISALRPVMAAKQMARTSSDAARVLVSVRSGSYESGGISRVAPGPTPCV